MSVLDTVISVFLALLFGFSGIDKLTHLDGFVSAINSYRVFPLPVGAFLAPIIIAAELTVAIGLMMPAWRRAASLQGALLLSLFTLALLVNRLLGARGVCGCWFSIEMAQGDVHFLLNGLLILLSLFLWRSAVGESTAGLGVRTGRNG